MAITLITGANRGLGLALVKTALKAGDTVLATARKPSEAKALQLLALDVGDRLQLVELDVTNEGQRDSLVQTIATQYGKLD